LASPFAAPNTLLSDSTCKSLLLDINSSNNTSYIMGDFYSSSSFKLMLLVGMVLQNSATVLVGRYSRSSVPSDELYVVNHLIVVTEIGKLIFSCMFEYVSTNGQLLHSVQVNIVQKPQDALKILVPALLYLVQNTLLYVALSNLTAPVFQVTYQAKLVTTAIVSVLMLNRSYSVQQWVCLVGLSLGVAVVVLGEDTKKVTTVAGDQSLTVGLIAVTIACMSSALAGVYFEKVVKTPSGGTGDKQQKPVSVWMRNIQLAFFTILTALAQNVWTTASATPAASSAVATASKSYFHGFTGWVWLLVLLQAGGGLLVAAVIKYADNVLKGLATGVSVCFATAVSTVLFGTPVSGQFSTGALLILVSVYVFSNPIPVNFLRGKSMSSSTPPSPSSSNSDMRPILPR
jgi:solute carrier family 35 (UDP-sugar transporter), member A1/2/3